MNVNTGNYSNYSLQKFGPLSEGAPGEFLRFPETNRVYLNS